MENSIPSAEYKQRHFKLRQLGFLLLVVATVTELSWLAFSLLQTNGMNPLKMSIFILFIVLLIPIALSFWTAFLGFILQLRGGDSFELTRMVRGPLPANLDLPLTAIIVPAYNEDPARLFAGLKASYESLEQTGYLSHFEFFILSDTTDPDIWIREEAAFADMRDKVSDPDRVFYRNRRENVERKTGNIADFCATWGDRYRYMIVFDADSIMTGTSLVNLTRLMEANPRAGLIQSPPLPVNRTSLFGRLYQFATHAYSSVFITGLNFWQGAASNYWGHNAIIRIRPFVEHCRLPKLSGKEPLGGSILSHDFVEGAYLRRAGWEVYLAGELRGSYEELPSSLIGYAARDRRWCQGNLQHARLLSTPGLHWISRIHMSLGIMSYLNSPLWLLLLLLSTVEGLRENYGAHHYFSQTQTLFPSWTISVQKQALSMFLLMVSILLLPKIFSFLLILFNSQSRALFGGGLRLAASVFWEIVCSALIAPVLAWLQTRFVLGILGGHVAKWDAQDRGDAGTSIKEAVQRHWFSTAIGIAWAALLLWTVPKLFWWLSPVLLGLILTIPISVISSRASLGEWAKKKGLFLTPEEVDPPSILERLHAELLETKNHPWATDRDGLVWLLEDSELFRAHLAWLAPSSNENDPLRKNYLEGLRLKVIHTGPHALAAKEKRDLLLDGDSIRQLRDEFALAVK